MARIKTTAKRKMSSFDLETDSQNYSSSESAGQGIKHKSISPPMAPPQPPSKKTKKPSSSKPTASTRRSSRVQSGVVPSSKKVPQDSTVHVVDSDDSKGNTSAKSIPNLSSKPSTPKRSKTKSTKQNSETNYTSKWIDKYVVHGKHIDLINLKNGGFNVEEVFDKLGWTSFFRVNEPQYPRLVKAFYVACNGCKGSSGFSFVLKGVHLEVNPTTLRKIIDLQDAGAHYFAETWYMQYMITRTSVLQSILINPRKPLVASNLPPMCRIFHNICVHSIVPRAGSFEKVTELDILIIHHLLTGTPLHLGNIIFSYMLNAAIVGRSALYGMILTKVFKFFKVPLDDEGSIQCNNLFSMKNIKQMRIYLPEQTSTSRKKKTASKKQKSASPLSHSRTPTSSFNSAGSTLPQSPQVSNNPSTHTTASSIKDAVDENPPQREEDGEDLLFDLNVSYDHHSSKSPHRNMHAEESTLPSQVSLNSSHISPNIAPSNSDPNLQEKSKSPLAPHFENLSKDKAKSACDDSTTNMKSAGTENKKFLKLLKAIRKDQKKLLVNFSHFQKTIAQFGLILEWVTKHLGSSAAANDQPPVLPAQFSFVPNSTYSSSEDSSSAE
uniref:Uncharacterized protein LOC101495131 n=1 Tax=Cicer arietinum TaxID=3827 RepID=A0A1S2Y7Q1_CICAR|nr:uncharacterized protein LOC101495131 [Cicer arietinum]